MATILQAFENDKQYEIELISTYRIPYFRLVVYVILTTDFSSLKVCTKYPDGKMLSIKSLKEQKTRLQEQINQQKSSIRSLKNLTQDLKTVDKNVEAILHNQVLKKQKTQESEL